jgi:ABC-type Mn2+/Zn2+ transport system permease subunit
MEASLASLVDTLTDPWTQGIMRRALLEVALIGAVGGALGCWIVLYGLSYSAESLSHAIFPGLALAAVTGIPLLLGGALGLAGAAIAIALAGQMRGIGSDTAIAVVVTALLGAGSMIALSPDSPPGIQNLLFGDLLASSDGDLALAGGLGLLVLVALRVLHGQLLTVGFDRSSARAFGGRPAMADVALLLLIALAILVAVQGLGNLLVVAALVAPAATARLVSHRIVTMMALATLAAFAAGAAGLYLSYYAGTAGGASVAGCLVFLYLLTAGAVALPRAQRLDG